MPRLFRASAYPRSIEVLGEHGLDLVAVMQRTAGVGHDDFAPSRPSRISVELSDTRPTRTFRVSIVFPFDHLNGQMVNGGTRNGGHRQTALGVDCGAGEHAHFERRMLVSDILTWPSWLVRSICGETSLDAPRELRPVIPGLFAPSLPD